MLTEEELSHSITNADTLRQSNRMEFPTAASVAEFGKLGCKMMGKSATRDGSEAVWNRRILSFFGAPSLVMAKLWELLMDEGGPWPSQTQKKHLLWAPLHLLKVCSSETVLA
jgi:hypothetical protein